jgi:hypothetical protein
MNRPYFEPKDFRDQGDYLDKTIVWLEKEYNKMAKKKKGILSNNDIEKVFVEVTNHFTTELTLEQQNGQQALYDLFMGAFAMLGDSNMAFEQIKKMRKMGMI